MQKSRIIISIIMLIIILAILVLCVIFSNNTYINNTISNVTEDVNVIDLSKYNVEYEEINKQGDITYIKLEEISGNILKITKAGTYSVSGTLDGYIEIDAKDLEVTLILNGATINSNEYSAVYVANAKQTTITLAENTINTITDGSSYTYSDLSQTEPDATLFSKDDLNINGKGKLIVNANYFDGIVSKDNLTINDAIIEVNSKDDGMRGKDCIEIKDAAITVNAEGDGLKATNDTDATLGYILIESGTININSSDDAIHSNGIITINNGTLEISSGDDGIHADSKIVIVGGEIKIIKSYEGIESATIEINGGNIRLNASDDGINIAGGMDSSSLNGRQGQNNFNTQDLNSNTLKITGGSIYVNSTGDGIDVNGSVYITDGIISVDGPVNNGNGALDYDKVFKVTGGTIIATGSIGMAQNPSSDSTQCVMSINLSNVQNANKVIKITDTNENEIITYTPSKQYQSAIISTPKLIKGETYKIYIDEEEIDEVTLSNYITSVGTMLNSVMNGGGMQQQPGVKYSNK